MGWTTTGERTHDLMSYPSWCNTRETVEGIYIPTCCTWPFSLAQRGSQLKFVCVCDWLNMCLGWPKGVSDWLNMCVCWPNQRRQWLVEHVFWFGPNSSVIGWKCVLVGPKASLIGCTCVLVGPKASVIGWTFLLVDSNSSVIGWTCVSADPDSSCDWLNMCFGWSKLVLWLVEHVCRLVQNAATFNFLPTLSACPLKEWGLDKIHSNTHKQRRKHSV